LAAREIGRGFNDMGFLGAHKMGQGSKNFRQRKNSHCERGLSKLNGKRAMTVTNVPLPVPPESPSLSRANSAISANSADDPHSVQRLSIFETTLQARARFLNS